MARGVGSSNHDDSANPRADERREQIGNVTQATFLEALKELNEINAKARSINEERKKIRKKWKANGIELGQLDATIKMAEWDRAEVRAHFDTSRKYAEWLGLPIGVQGDLFTGQPDDKVQKHEWFKLGQVSSRMGHAARPPEECPPEYVSAWMAGFNDEDEKSWTLAEIQEAQMEAAANIDPQAPNNVAQITDALKAKPRKGATSQQDDKPEEVIH